MPLEPRLYNPFLQTLGRWPTLSADVLAVIKTGVFGAASQPNADTYNAMIEARRATTHPAKSCLPCCTSHTAAPQAP